MTLLELYCLKQRANKKIPLLILSATGGRLRLEAAPSLGRGRQTSWQRHKPATSPWLALLELGILESGAGCCIATRTCGCDSCQGHCPWRSTLRWRCCSLCRGQRPPALLPRAFQVVSIQLASHLQSPSPGSRLG